MNRFKIVHRRRRRTIFNGLFRRVRSLRKDVKVGHANQLINRRSIQVIRWHTHGNRTLRLATKGLIQLFISVLTRARLFGHLTHALSALQVQCTQGN